MKKSINETILALLPDVPALQVVWVGEATPLLEEMRTFLAPSEGKVCHFSTKDSHGLGEGAPRSYEALILNPEGLALGTLLLESCWERLENSAIVCLLGSLPEPGLLEAAGFSNPSQIECRDGPIGVVAKSFAWGSM